MQTARREESSIIKTYGFVIVIIALLSFSGIFSHSLWKRDEARVAEIGREMWLSGQYVMPTLNRQPFLEKPPLYWWVMSASYGLFGVSDGTARLPSAVFGLLTLLFTFLIGKRLGNNKTGVISMLVLATTTQFFIITHRCLVDNALIFFITLGYYGFFIGYRSEKKKPKWSGYTLMAASCGLAFLSKGLVGPGLIVGPAAITLLLRRDLKELKSILPQIGVGLVIFGAIVAPWIIGLYKAGGSPAIKAYLLQNTLGRMLPSVVGHYAKGHRHPFYYYFGRFPGDFIPWILSLPAVIWYLKRSWPLLSEKKRRGYFLFLALFAAGFILLSLAGTKRGVYLVPLYPLLAVPIGGWLAYVGDTPSRANLLDTITLQAFLGLFAVIVLAATMGAVLIAVFGIGSTGYYSIKPVQDIVRPLLFGIVPAGLAGFFFLGKKVLSLRRAKTPPSLALLFTTALILIFIYQAGAVRIMEPVKSVHRLTTELIAPHLTANTSLAGFRLTEFFKGIIPFDTGKYVNNYEDPALLRRFLEKNPAALVVLQKREAVHLPEAIRNRLELIGEKKYRRHHTAQLYRLQKD